jgi:hypothetical protein
MEKVIAHYRDGRIVKGHTSDFTPGQDWFSLAPLDYTIGGKPSQIRIPDLKGIFFVHNFMGDPTYTKINTFTINPNLSGSRVKVTFRDGEVLQGIAPEPTSDRAGFIVIPADKFSNNKRCYVVRAAIREVEEV